MNLSNQNICNLQGAKCLGGGGGGGAKSMPENTNFKNQSINQSINQTLFTHGTISQRQKLKYLQDVIFQ